MSESILIVAGEVSGDVHAAAVVREARQRHSDISFWGLGGDSMRVEGVEILQHVDRLSVMGIVEVLKQYRYFRMVFKDLLAEVDVRKPKKALLVDYPGFNLRLAKELKKRGIEVFYYISPKVWAWNKKRIPKMAQVIDRLMVIFPFEVSLFSESGLQVDYVGNPLVQQIDHLLETEPVELPWGAGRRVGLLPGSRRQEIERILPTMLEAAKHLEEEFAEVSFIIAPPNERIEALVRKTIAMSPVVPKSLGVVCGQARELMRQAEAAMVTSGTATLETALIGTPHILVYKTSAFTYWFGRSVIKIKHIGLVNIVAGKTVCPELLQQEASPEKLAQSTASLMKSTPECAEMVKGYATVRSILTAKKAAENVTEILFEK